MDAHKYREAEVVSRQHHRAASVRVWSNFVQYDSKALTRLHRLRRLMLCRLGQKAESVTWAYIENAPSRNQKPANSHGVRIENINDLR